ncbi:MAG: T9SS type A sorting domain-containing protein, partial [Candidatus Zixiibacteriota bacterium]
WTGDLNLNEYPYEIADAVLYANYFIYGDEVFDIDYDLQILASDVNKDGFYPSIADFVFLVRIILEDISPKHKLAPSTELANVTVVTQGDAVKVKSFSNTGIGAGLYVFKHSGEVKNLTSNTDMNVKYNDANGELRVLVYSFEGKSISAGEVDLFSFETKGVELVEVKAADFYGSAMKSTISTKALPTRFALMNNYPNPFNLNTNISFALPIDSKISLKLYNIAGQLVKSFEGTYQAGNHTIVWDGTNTRGEEVASGIYLYKLVTGDYTSTKKMVLMK